MTYKYPVDLVDTLRRNELSTGESTVPRMMVNSNAVPSPTGQLRLTYLSAKKTEAITQVRVITGTTAASGGTLARIGLYSVDASGNITLVASIVDDHTNLWIAPATTYTRSFSASYTKIRGNRYAVGYLFVGTTSPTFYGNSFLPSSEMFLAPALSGVVTGQSDLPSSVAVGSITAGTSMIYAALLP